MNVTVSEIKQYLRQQLSQKQFDTLILPHQIITDDNQITFYVDSEVHKKVINRNIFKIINSKYSQYQLSIVVNSNNKTFHSSTACQKTTVKINKKQANERFTFNNFVVGESNRNAFVEIKKLSTLTDSDYDDIFILFANCGLGKTHLCQSLKHKIETEQQGDVLYSSAYEYVQDFKLAIAEVKQNKSDFKKLMALKTKYNNANLVIFEDIHLPFSKKLHYGNELIDILRTRQKNNLKTIFTTAKPLHTFKKNIDDSIWDRLQGAKNITIQKVDNKLKIELLQNIAKNCNIQIAKNCNLHAIASLIPSDSVRVIWGLIQTLATNKQTVNENNVESYFRNINHCSTTDISINRIAEVTAEVLKIEVEQLRSNSRQKNVALARKLFFGFATIISNSTSEQIAQFCGRNQNTFYYNLNSLKQLIKKDNIFINKTIDTIQSKLHLVDFDISQIRNC